jgi:hypothetical protein
MPPSNPKTTYGVGTECATALVIPSLCSISAYCFTVPGFTHEGFAVWLDGVVCEISARDYLGPICGGVADLFTDVDGGLGDGLRAWSARNLGCYSTVLLKAIRDLDNVRGVWAKWREGSKVATRCRGTMDCRSE